MGKEAAATVGLRKAEQVAPAEATEDAALPMAAVAPAGWTLALCRRHGISAHSLVTVQARKRRWQEKRRAYQARSGEAFIERHADRMADRQAEIRDKALDAIDEAITKFRADLRATKPVRRPDGSVTEEPAWVMTPKDLCVILDRFAALFDRPSSISQHQGLTVTSEVSADVLRDFIEATRGLDGAPSLSDPLPRRLDR